MYNILAHVSRMSVHNDTPYERKQNGAANGNLAWELNSNGMGTVTLLNSPFRGIFVHTVCLLLFFVLGESIDGTNPELENY